MHLSVTFQEGGSDTGPEFTKHFLFVFILTEHDTHVFKIHMNTEII